MFSKKRLKDMSRIKYTKRGIVLLFLLLTAIIVGATISSSTGLQPNDSTSTSSARKQELFSKIKQTDYVWIWDEFENNPDAVPAPGDDPVYWGGSLGPYYNYSEIVSKLLKLNETFPEIVDVFSIGTSYEGKEIYALKITNETNFENKSEFLLVAHHHAREAITILNAFYFIDKVIHDLPDNETLQQIINEREIYVVPSLNVDSLKYLPIFPWMRKNAHDFDEDNDGSTDDENETRDVNGDYYVDWIEETDEYEGVDEDDDGTIGEDLVGGVDLNRNYPYQWGNITGASLDPRDYTYAGERAASEPETQAMLNLINTHDFNFAISLHSGIYALLAPWSYSGKNTTRESEYSAQSEVFENLTNIRRTFLYEASGEWGDYVYSLKKTFVYTIETFVNYSALSYEVINGTTHWRGIWDYFNPSADQAMNNSAIIYKGLFYFLTEPLETYTNQRPIVEFTGLMDPDNDGIIKGDVLLSWEIDDEEYDTKHNSTVYYSLDGGKTWTVIAKDLETDNIVFDTTAFEDGTEIMFKVSVKDWLFYTMDIYNKKLTIINSGVDATQTNTFMGIPGFDLIFSLLAIGVLFVSTFKKKSQ